jgi:hypothetical protein
VSARAGGEPPLELRQFTSSYESLGILIDYFAKTPPFARLTVAEFVIALKHQLAHGHHFCAFRGDRLVGYCGWLWTTREIGERWMRGDGELKSVATENVDSAALTVVRADDPAALPLMIRALRERGKGKRIFFRRDYAESSRPQRRQSVLNR